MNHAKPGQNQLSSIAIVGAGTMGRGIAVSAAIAGYQVVLYDIADRLLEDALVGIFGLIDQGVKRGKVTPETAREAKKLVQVTTVLEVAAAVDLVIEAIPEDLELKKETFSRLGSLAPAQTILASNTSSLSIDALAGATNRSDRFLGLHFFNPAHIMQLVEVIRGDETSRETLAAAETLVKKLGKTAVHCQDRPAFIVNRVARPFYGEALRLLGESAADVPTIDRLVKSLGFPMGPFELIDLVGSDVNLAVTNSVYDQYFHDPKYRPHPIQQRMVSSGRLGRKSGRGFYNYQGKSQPDRT
ncbi:MAG: 3-hydroxyacyl-CoA dehydrogenase NAD-binding domain-containing protein [Chloroflexota bacterium]